MIVGIDLGTTNSLIGAMDAGFPVLIADAAGRRLTPSVVAFPEGGDPVVGWAARELPGADVVTSIKRRMGSGERLTAGGRKWLPEEISALILAELKRGAERALGVEVREAVITVPAYFNDAQRAATKRAGELAGLEVRRILSEPTAAALAYGLDKLGERSKVAVYDLGGGTFDISVLELAGEVFQVLATHGDTQLGGDDFDAAVAERFGISPQLAREAREQLTTQDEASDVALRLPELESICRPILERTRGHCLRALADAGLAAGDLDEVVLVGGATRMPMVRRLVAEVFGREPNVTQHPDEAVALGAVLQAGILEGSVRNVTLLDVTPLSLGIETFGGLMNVLIPRNTTIPIKKGEMFTNAVAGQAAMRIAVLQGERELARDNWRLGEFDVDFTPAPKGQARVGVQFEIDANGILHVLTRDVATGRDTTIEIRSAVNVADDAVEEMIGASVEHAFEDMADRQFAEAKLKAEEMLPAIDVAFEKLELAAEDRRRIEALVAEVREAIADPNLQRLKKKLGELDDATQELAALLIESLMRE
ncbi:MAG: Hsp70 family protein [Terrimicrobiaceae bacterium]|nr:Hsp70 family protein [Terrimicrobiaceae bacterium]